MCWMRPSSVTGDGGTEAAEAVARRALRICRQRGAIELQQPARAGSSGSVAGIGRSATGMPQASHQGAATMAGRPMDFRRRRRSPLETRQLRAEEEQCGSLPASDRGLARPQPVEDGPRHHRRSRWNGHAKIYYPLKIVPWAVAGPSRVWESREPGRTHENVSQIRGYAPSPGTGLESGADELACKPDKDRSQLGPAVKASTWLLTAPCTCCRSFGTGCPICAPRRLTAPSFQSVTGSECVVRAM